MSAFLNTVKSKHIVIKTALLRANRDAFNNLNAQVIEHFNREEPAIKGVCWGGGDAILVQRSWNNQK